MLRELLSSKKFITALVASVGWLVGRIGWHVDSETLAGAVTPLLMFILSQGITDRGKSAAIIGAAQARLIEKNNELIAANVALNPQ